MVARFDRGVLFWVGETRQLISFAQQNHLTLFASSSSVEALVRAGLPYSHSSLTTTVLFATNDASMAGVINLIALQDRETTAWQSYTLTLRGHRAVGSL